MARLKGDSVIDVGDRYEPIVTIPQIENEGKNKLDQIDFNVSSGTFTPRLFGQTTAGSFTYGHRIGEYVTIGNLVFFTLSVYITAIGTAPAGVMNIGDLPFAATSVNSVRVGRVRGLKFDTSKLVTGSVSAVSDYPNAVYLYNSNRDGAFWNVWGGDIQSNFSIIISGFYFK